MPVTFSNFFSLEFVLLFLQQQQQKKQPKCDGYMRHTANKSAPKEQ